MAKPPIPEPRDQRDRVSPAFDVLRGFLIAIMAKAKVPTSEIADRMGHDRSYIIRRTTLQLAPRTPNEGRILALAKEYESQLRRMGVIGLLGGEDIVATLAGGERPKLGPLEERRAAKAAAAAEKAKAPKSTPKKDAKPAKEPKASKPAKPAKPTPAPKKDAKPAPKKDAPKASKPAAKKKSKSAEPTIHNDPAQVPLPLDPAQVPVTDELAVLDTLPVPAASDLPDDNESLIADLMGTADE